MRKMIVISMLLISALLSAQTPASVNWLCMAPDSQNVSSVSGNVLGLPEVGSPGFVVRDYSNGPGPDQRWWPYENGSAVSWGNDTGQVDTRWVEFAVYPKANNSFQADSITLNLGGKGTDKIRANLVFDKNSDFSAPTTINSAPLALVKDTDSLYQFILDEDVSDQETLYVRIYPWYEGSPSTSKYLYVRDVKITGTTRGVTYAASASWPLTNPADGGTGFTVTTSGQVSAQDEFFNNTEINQYTGPNNSQRIRMANTNNSWPAGLTDQIDTVFIQFSVSPKAGYTFYTTSISLDLGAKSSATFKANLWYSTDPDFNNPTKLTYQTGDTVNNYLNSTELESYSFNLNEVVNPGETFYFRVYPWNEDASVKTGKYLCLQNILIGGEIEGSPTEAIATWPFVTDDTPVTTGPVLAKKSTYSDKMKFYSQLTDLSDQNSVSHHCGAIQTVSKTWYAATAPTDSLWFQYEVSPKVGGTFFVDNVSLYLGGWFSSNLRAEVVYSKDSSFATETVLIPDTSLVGNAVMPLSATLNETVNSGETFYLRVKPYNTKAEGWAKLVAVDSVVISGTTVGVTADPPTVATASVDDISTTFVKSGGNVSTDGGSPVTAKGVCWNTTGSPTVADSKTEDGTGSGAFVSIVTGLTPGASYFLRAYATNTAGTAYGDEIAFATLDSTTVPTVTTASVSNILVTTAQCGGSVTAWGGDTITVRGVCWNTAGSPTLADSYTENGSGLGSFTSTLYPLTENTTYYVRAYATNSKGTGYGVEQTFVTQSPAPDVLKVVAQDGSGDYTTVQAAFDAVPEYYTGKYTIFVKAGTYYEKLFLDRTKPNVILQGEDAETTILTYDDYAGKAGGTSQCQSVAIDADDFVAMDITFQNTVVNDGSFNDQQAVALRVNGDRQSYYRCRLLGYQDTYYTWGGRGTGRVYMKDCYIEGSVDFIFGRDIVAFDQCEIHINRDGGSLTAASTEADSKFGYVFLDCSITADEIGFNGNAITSFILGRPWQSAPRTVFIRCEEPASVNPAGWSTWNVTPALYAEYKCTGAGSDFSNRLAISRQLTDEEAPDYTIENIFAKTSNPAFGYDWLPEEPIKTGVDDSPKNDALPTEFALSQNYPNPFNPVTTIKYDLPVATDVTLKLYNALGEQVMILVNEKQQAGRYTVSLDGSRLASGVYFYQIKTDGFRKIKKMLLLK